MDNQEVVKDAVKKEVRGEAAKSTLPQPGRPVPSRAYPGALIVVEGTDGSGKSTQLYLLKRWLEIGGYRLHFTEWNSSPLVKSATRRGKQRRLLTPTTFSLLHAADFADRCERQIMPLLQGDYLVLADRYIYTAFARDAARGCPPRWLRNLYRFAPIPDITFYFRAPLDVAVHRILSGRPKLHDLRAARLPAARRRRRGDAPDVALHGGAHDAQALVHGRHGPAHRGHAADAAVPLSLGGGAHGDEHPRGRRRAPLGRTRSRRGSRTSSGARCPTTCCSRRRPAGSSTRRRACRRRRAGCSPTRRPRTPSRRFFPDWMALDGLGGAHEGHDRLQDVHGRPRSRRCSTRRARSSQNVVVRRRRPPRDAAGRAVLVHQRRRSRRSTARRPRARP